MPEPDGRNSSQAADDNELNTLLAAYLDGALTEAGQRQRLANLIAKAPGGVKLYADLICLDVLLARHHGASPPDEVDLREVGMEIRSPGGDLSDATIMDAIREPDVEAPGVAEPTPSREFQHVTAHIATPRRFWTRPRFAAAAAVLLVVAGVTAWLRFGAAAPDVATLVSATDPTWEQAPGVVGAPLAAGRRLRLRSGIVEIAFVSGTRVVVEGPADFELTGANRAVLHAGRMIARVPPEARGFSVRSSDLLITDLGTEFGISLMPGKVADVHVFQGTVDVTLPAGSAEAGGASTTPIRLTSGMAARCPVSGSGVTQKIPVDRQAFRRILPAVFPSPGYDVGPVSRPGSDAYSKVDGVYSVTGCGKDIWGTSDAFRFVSISHSGDLSVVVRVLSQTDTDEWAKAGLMIRSSTAPDAAFAEMVLTPRHGVSFQRRTRDGEDMNYATTSAPASPPVWLKLVRRGKQFSGFYSVDGVTWSQVGAEESIAMPDTALVGLAVTSKNTTAASTARFDNAVISP